jgi:para-nitrobenzyl esterase
MGELQLPLNRLADISSLPWETIVAAMSATDPVIGNGGLYFGPVLDERSLQQHPFYPDAPAISAHIPNGWASDVFFAATTAARSWRGAIIEVEARAAQGAPAYAYELDWQSPLDGGKWGAPHTLDIPLVFDNIAAEGSLTGSAADAQKVADQMSETFIAFARTGNPNNEAIPAWEPYQLPRRQTLLINTESKLGDDPRGKERELFAKLPWTQQGT